MKHKTDIFLNIEMVENNAEDSIPKVGILHRNFVSFQNFIFTNFFSNICLAVTIRIPVDTSWYLLDLIILIWRFCLSSFPLRNPLKLLRVQPRLTMVQQL